MREEVAVDVSTLFKGENDPLQPADIWLRAAVHRFPPSLVGDFMQHSHESAWHMFHNTIR